MLCFDKLTGEHNNKKHFLFMAISTKLEPWASKMTWNNLTVYN